MSELFDCPCRGGSSCCAPSWSTSCCWCMIRMSGKRTMGQFTPFDVLLIVLLGNAVQNALLGKDTSLPGGLLLAAVLIALNWSSASSPRAAGARRSSIEGAPVVLARDGKSIRGRAAPRAGQRERLRRSAAPEPARLTSGMALLETNGASAWCEDATARISVGRRRKTGLSFGQPVARPQVVGQARFGAARLRRRSRIPSAPAAAGSSGSTRCARRSAGRTACRGRTPG